MGSRRDAAILGTLWFAFSTSLMLNARLPGRAPANGDPPLVWPLLAAGTIGGLGMGLQSVITSRMIADLTDEHERLHGTRRGLGQRNDPATRSGAWPGGRAAGYSTVPAARSAARSDSTRARFTPRSE